MIRRKKISEKQSRDAMIEGEFGREIVSSQKNVTVILTQSWCPEWIILNRHLEFLDIEKNEMDIYELEYDRKITSKIFLDSKKKF